MKMALAVSAVLLLTGCVQAAPQASRSPAVTDTAAVIASPSGGVPTPSPAASPATGLTCNLPVVVGSTPGFITFPAGSFRADPQPNIIRVSGWPFAPATIYDRPYARWLTIPRWFVSSDGSQYLFRGNDGSVHLVTMSTGSDNVLVASASSPSGNGWFPVGITKDAAYIASASNMPGPAPAPFFGLWSMKLDGTGLKSITQSGVWTIIGSGAAWGVTPQTSAALNHLDLSTGASTAWVAPADGAVFLYDVDAVGNPVIGVASGDYFGVALVTAKDTLMTITLPAGTYWGGLGHRVQNGLATRSAIWITVEDGSLLFSSDGKDFSLAATVAGVSNVAAECA